MKRVFLVERHSVPFSYIILAMENLVRRTETLNETKVIKLSGEIVARIGVGRERYVPESSKMFASETRLKRVAHDFVKSIWYSEESSTGAWAGSDAIAANIVWNFEAFSSRISISICPGVYVEYLCVGTFARLPNDTAPCIL